MLLGLNIKLPNRRSSGGYVPVPGNMFIVKDSAATEYIVRLAVRDGSGVDYTVPVSAKTSDGTEYYVPAYDPSLYLDYTSTFESVPGKQPGYYLVDDVSGNLTQTTFSSLITFSRSSNATRYSPTGQLEYAPHNLLLQSQTFDNASWTKTASSITANTIVAPDGTLTGDKITSNISQLGFVVQSLSQTTGTAYTVSVYAKAGEYNFCQLRITGTVVPSITRAYFNLANGTTTGVANCTASITPVGNGWYRCSITYTTTSTATASPRIYGQVDASDTISDGTSGIYIWGAQLETGAFATSYIPTTTAATTRSADIASIGTLSPWYNASAGTIYAEFQTPITGNAFQASFNDATANNRVGILSSSSQFVAARNTGGAGVLFTPGTANAPSLVNVNKSALAFANTDYALCGNGGTVATASTYNVPTVTKLELGQQLTATLLNGYLRRITYTPRRLTNAELQSLTS